VRQDGSTESVDDRTSPFLRFIDLAQERHGGRSEMSIVHGRMVVTGWVRPLCKDFGPPATHQSHQTVGDPVRIACG
jgi:hypothetical protein